MIIYYFLITCRSKTITYIHVDIAFINILLDLHYMRKVKYYVSINPGEILTFDPSYDDHKIVPCLKVLYDITS